MKKSVRLTIAGVLAVTALVVAIIPTKGVQADPPFNKDTDIPVDVDTAMAVDPFVTGNTVVPNLDPGAVRYWAFPKGEEIEYYDSALGANHKYYKIKRDGMNPNQPVVPIFEISSTKVPARTLPQCICHYTGGKSSGYSPAGGKLDLSANVIYDYDGEAEEVYWGPKEENAAEHTPTVWTRYTETRVDLPANDDMAIWYGFVGTPDYHYFNIRIEKWVRPWTQDPIDEHWIAPVTPDFATEDADDITLVEEVCKQTEQISYIGNEAFKGVANFESMEILSEGSSNGIYMIGDSAFEDCTRLESINFGDNLEFLGTKAFYHCDNLIDVNYGKSTSEIGDGAFADCSKLSYMVLPKTLKKIGTAAFMNCRALTDQIPDYLTHDGVYNSRLFGGTDSDEGINSPVELGSYAFCNCESLEYTKMPTQAKAIDGTHGQYGLYAGCTNLKQIELPYTTPGFKVTPTTFLGCRNLECVRVNNKTGTAKQDWQFINDINIGYAPGGSTKNVSDDFVLWGPNPYVEPNPMLLSYAQKNSLPYMYWDSSDMKFKYILTLQDSYEYTFSEEGTGEPKDFAIEKITQLAGATATELDIPAKVAGHKIVKISDNACGQYNGSEYQNNLTMPTKIQIADSIATIGENAFRKCKNLKEVDFVHIENTESAPSTSIGASCFKDCTKLEEIRFRDDNFDGRGYYDINIDASTVGADAFLTNNPNGLVMYGRFSTSETDTYWPYEYAIDPNNITCETKADSYITYRSGNPWNIECKYCKPNSGEPGYVSLIKYPTADTVVGTETVEMPAGSGTFVDQDVYIRDLIERYNSGETLSPNQEEIIHLYTMEITVPYGVQTITYASNDLGTESLPGSCDNDYFIRTNDYKTPYGYDLQKINFTSVERLPDVSTLENKPFSECRKLNTINFLSNVKDLGTLPFYNVADEATSAEPLAEITTVMFLGENDASTATKDDPCYVSDNGIIYAYYTDDDGKQVCTIVEVLQSRGKPGGIGQADINETNDWRLKDVTNIEKDAFRNCDYINSVDFTLAEGEEPKLEVIPEDCFVNCNMLKYVTLPASVNKIQPRAFQHNHNLKDVYVYSKAINIDETAFTDTESTTFHAYKETSVPHYVDMVNKKEGRTYADELKYEEMSEQLTYTVIFYCNCPVHEVPVEIYRATGVLPGAQVAPPDDLIKETHNHEKEGYTFTRDWYSTPVANAWRDVQQNSYVYAKFIQNSSSSSSTSTTVKPTSTSSKSSSTSGSSKSSSSSKVSTSITSTTVQPVIVSGTGTLVGATGTAGSTLTGTGTNTSGSGNNGGNGAVNNTRNVGNSKIVSTTGGITDTSKMSATVNGSSDNYVIKISETQEANEMADQALTAAFGSLDAIRYLPIDISLYDSTGTQKISPIPDGVNINITMPIPDNLAIYGGNAKVACTESGILEKIQPKFTVINGVPCMNFTVNHLSPYVIYVDTNNLTATGTLDSTPKTGDPIHPKWFLVIGLAAVSGIMFLKRDKKETFEAA